MTELTYDPELPFAVVDTVGKVEARFKEESDAKIWIHDVAGYGKIVDTTPKPKIPEDAQHITWGESKVAYSSSVGRRPPLWYRR